MNDFTIVNLQDLTTATGLTENDFLAIGQGSNALTKATIQQVGTFLGVSASVVLGDKNTAPTEPSFAFAEAGTYLEWGNVEIIGDLGILIFDGTNFSKTEINFIANGVVEEGNTEAVSGGEVFSKISPISESLKDLNNTINGEEDITPETWINGIINTNGVFEVNSAYRVSDFLPVSEFEKYKAALTGSESTLMVSAYTEANQESFINGSPLNIPGTADSLTVKFLNFEVDDIAKFIRIGFHNSTPIEDIYLHKVLDDSIIKSLERISEEIEGKDITPTTWINGYVTQTGTVSTTVAYRLSPFIPVDLTGQYLAGVSGSSSVLMVSAYSDADQSSFISDSVLNVRGYGTSTELKDLSFKISEENVKYIRIVCQNQNVNDAYLIKTGLENRVKELENQSNSFDIKYFSTIKKEIFSRRKAVFSFIFDDLNDTDELVYNIFKEFDFNVGFAIQSSKLNLNNAPMYQEMYINGTTILSHGVTSANDEPSMKNSKIALKNNDFVVSGWVTNSSTLPSELIPVVKKYYGYAFTSSPPAKGVMPGVSNFDQTKDPCELKRVGLESWNKDEIEQAALKSLIDYAIDNNLLITFYGHKMPATYLNTDGITSVFTEDDLRGVLSYLQEKQGNGLCDVLSPDDAIYQYYKGIIF